MMAISASNSLRPPFSETFFFSDKMKKRTRHDRDIRKRPQDFSIANQNASASSWGAADYTESESTTSSSSDSGFDADVETPLDNTADPDATFTQPPPRKKRHLDADDVGRFASMSIERNGKSRDRRGIRPSEIITPASPKLHPIFDTNATLQPMQQHNGTHLNSVSEMKPSSIEEPQDNDELMRARRGPTTIQLDSDRFFVTSLDDSSSDEEESVEKAEEERVNRLMENVTDAQLRDALSSTQDGKDDPNFIINGELISKLQALEWQQRMGIERDKAAQPLFSRPFTIPKRRSGSTTSETMASGSALILWRQPENLSLNFGKTSMPMSAAKDQLPDSPVVFEDGQFAYVHRPTSTEQSTAINDPLFQDLPIDNVQDDTMDMD